MIPALLLALLLHKAPGDGLIAAREALERGAYGEAETLALASAVPPREGAALELAGLARFRAGRPAEALEALDAAGRAADAPPRSPWQFNRAACLYELGRYAEAEATYLDAAAGSTELAPVALVNAAYAALDAGDLQRTDELTARARAASTDATRPLVQDLEEQLARARGKALLNAGRSALEAGRRAEGRRQLRAALALGLEPADAASARSALEASAQGLMARGRGWDVGLRAGAGYDSNVLQSGLQATQQLAALTTGQVDSGAILGSASVAYRAGVGERVAIEGGYALDSLAYLATVAEDYSLQLHTLGIAAELSVTDALRTGVAATGQLAFTGIGAFRALQRAAGASGWVAWDETDATTTRVDLGWTRNVAGGAEFSYLTGTRLDARIVQQLRLRTVAALELGYRYRDEGIGAVTVATTATVRVPGCLLTACPVEYTQPFGYVGHSAFAGARVRLGRAFQAGALVGYERRAYSADSVLRVTTTVGSGSEIDRRRREDDRLFAGAWGTYRLAPWLALALRYDLVVNGSTIATTYDDRNYVKHVVALETVASW